MPGFCRKPFPAIQLSIRDVTLELLRISKQAARRDSPIALFDDELCASARYVEELRWTRALHRDDVVCEREETIGVLFDESQQRVKRRLLDRDSRVFDVCNQQVEVDDRIFVSAGIDVAKQFYA